MQRECKHKWKLISKMNGISEYERVVSIHRMSVLDSSMPLFVDFEIPANLSTTRTLVQVLQCKRCGELKKFVDKY